MNDTGMTSLQTNAKTTRSFERFLVIVGAAVCLAAAVRIWQMLNAPVAGSIGADTTPLPGLYVLEMSLLSGVSLVGVFRDWVKAIWAVAGACLAFGVMGAWSIGLMFLPTGLLFAFASLLATQRLRQNLVANLSVCLTAGTIQIGVMLMVIRLSAPTAVL